MLKASDARRLALSLPEVAEVEFTRQAESFRDSPTLSAPDVTSRVGEALGPGLGRVLDLACGPGLLIPTLSECAASVVGIDVTWKNLLLARQSRARGSIHLVRGLAERLPFAIETFDAVVLRLALHHFLRPGSVLGAARSLLRPRGRLVVLDLLAPEDPATRGLRDAIERLRDPSHTALLSREALTSHLAESGFELRKQVLWSQPREFSEWAAIVNEPRRMADLELVLRALCRTGGDPAGLALREEGAELWFTYDWGLFVAEVA
jgi:ubiquinone/menaquinone biosynthesis C-methylase UbiE